MNRISACRLPVNPCSLLPHAAIVDPTKLMILEVAVLDVKPGGETAFERDFETASAFISSVDGYIAHELQRCVERRNRYILLVRWKTIEAHTGGFRKSAQYLDWKKLLHHYYDPFPRVEHYSMVHEKSAIPGI